MSAVPAVEGLRFTYALYELPPGRLPFRRWRWELWHGGRLEAAGWRVLERDAVRALRLHAARVGNALFGLRAPERVAAPAGGFRPGMTLRFDAGGIPVAVAPRHLEER